MYKASENRYSDMKYNRCGNSGLLLPAVSLGLWHNFGDTAQYANMKECLEPVRYIVEIAKQAMAELGIKPLIVPIRGGTNGSKLSFMGLPTPNLSNGAHNGHGRYEYIPVSSMEKIVNVIVKISELCAKM